MRLSVSMESTEDIFHVKVPDDKRVSDLIALISSQRGIPADDFLILKDGKRIDNSDNDLKSAGLCDNDMIVLIPAVPQSISVVRPTTSSPATIDFSNIRVPGTKGNSGNRPSNDPHLLPDPDVAAVLNNRDSLRQLTALTTGLTGTELDEVVKWRLNVMAKKRKINMDLETAYEHYPEMFAPVSMLFINCKVGKIPLKAFVDSGAQVTIMSEDCAYRCGLDSLIDRRWQGLAHGVGTETILGRVHNSTLEINGAFLPATFLILKGHRMDLLLGLDMLRRHQCCIDLKRNVLTIGDKTLVPFLHESEIGGAIESFNSPLTDDPLSRYYGAEKEKIEQLISQGVPMERAVQELLEHNWDIDEALIAYIKSDDAS